MDTQSAESTAQNPATAQNQATTPEQTTAPSREQDPGFRSVEVQRVAQRHYRATGANGATVDFGQGEGLMSPVELLLAAVAGCSAVDVDVVTSRRAEPEEFTVTTSAIKDTDETGGARLRDVELEFRVRFPEDEAGRKAAGMVERLVRLSHDKDCTVSRTVEHPTSVVSRAVQG